MKKESFILTVGGEQVTSEIYGPTDDINKIVLFCHGFPGTNRLVKLAPILESNDIAMVEINYRGDKKSQGNFSFLGSIEDIKAVTDYLKNNYSNSKIYALGYSMAGFYVSNIIRDNPNLFDKAILLNPVVDTISFFSDKILMEELWKYAKDILSLSPPDFYDEEIKLINKKHNPMSFANKIKTPVYLVQSTDDEVLPLKIAKNFYSLLKCEKRFIDIPNAKHDLTGNEKEFYHCLI